MNTGEYRICSWCIMDTSDPEISFDSEGRCNHCRLAERLLATRPCCLPPEERANALDALVMRIRAAGRKGRYDCVIGVSGGVDSTYVAYRVKQLGLRPLAVHLDNGWNSRLAVTNIENVLKRMDIDLYTHVIDWDEFKDLQLAFLRASTPDGEIPTDHAIFSLLYQVAARNDLRYIIAGLNLSTESILPRSWSQGHADWKYVRAVHSMFGKAKLETFPHRTFLQKVYHRLGKRIRWVNVLDYLEYRRKDAVKVLEQEVGWEDYGGKHHESIYTKFFQTYILPVKFGYDKRRAHLSSAIVSGEISREAALEEMRSPPYDQAALREDKAYVLSKFGISEAEFEVIMRLPVKRFQDYPSYERTWYYDFARRFVEPRRLKDAAQ